MTPRPPVCVWAAWLALGLALCMARPALAADTLRLDEFDRTHAPNELIDNWNSRKIAPLFGDGEIYFFQFVHKSASEHYLHVKSGKDNSFSVGAEIPFDLTVYPVLSWEWKITKLPKGGDVRVKARDDQAGSICVIVNPGLVGFDSLCYLWENDGPIDTPITSTKREDSRYLILHVGMQDEFGKWVRERRHILNDYVRVFGRKPKDKAIIGVQIDSDSTASSAEAYYRNIVLRRN